MGSGLEFILADASACETEQVPVVKHRRRTLLSYLKCRAVAWIALLVMLALVVGIFIASTQGAVSLPSGVKVPHPK